MDNEVRHVEARKLLAVGGGLADIPELWHRCGQGFHAGWLRSVEAGVQAVGMVVIVGDVARYYAGVPVDPRTTAVPEQAAAGFELVDAPAGRYATVNHRGRADEIHDIAVALAAAARTAGEHPTGDELEIYYATGMPEGGHNVDIGARLAG